MHASPRSNENGAGDTRTAPADPWLIAADSTLGRTVITDERKTSTRRILYVCRQRSVQVRCINGPEFFAEVGSPYDDPEQSKRFLEAAREAEADESDKGADRAFRSFVTSKKR
jgi:hypothetical protein